MKEDSEQGDVSDGGAHSQTCVPEKPPDTETKEKGVDFDPFADYPLKWDPPWRDEWEGPDRS